MTDTIKALFERQRKGTLTIFLWIQKLQRIQLTIVVVIEIIFIIFEKGTNIPDAMRLQQNRERHELCSFSFWKNRIKWKMFNFEFEFLVIFKWKRCNTSFGRFTYHVDDVKNSKMICKGCSGDGFRIITLDSIIVEYTLTIHIQHSKDNWENICFFLFSHSPLHMYPMNKRTSHIERTCNSFVFEIIVCNNKFWIKTLRWCYRLSVFTTVELVVRMLRFVIRKWKCSSQNG